jgi:hypothetical protein
MKIFQPSRLFLFPCFSARTAKTNAETHKSNTGEGHRNFRSVKTEKYATLPGKKHCPPQHPAQKRSHHELDIKDVFGRGSYGNSRSMLWLQYPSYDRKCGILDDFPNATPKNYIVRNGSASTLPMPSVWPRA